MPINKQENKSKQLREQEWEQSSDYKNAVIFANQALDRPYADPDDEIATISRQFLRMIERLANQRKAILEEVRSLEARTEVNWDIAKREQIDEYKMVKLDDVIKLLEGETK